MKAMKMETTEIKQIHADKDLICSLCKRCDNIPDKYGEKITLQQHKLTVHYFCLLMSSGICQRGEEDEDVHGFLVDDIKKEIRRSSRLRCMYCKKIGASVGCSIKRCRQMVHMPCGLEQEFIFQFTDLFPSFCKKHAPSQSWVSSPSLPLSCSVCLEPIEPVLSYNVLKCPVCHGSWFHRNCVQRYAHSAAMFFFKCTLCNNKDQFQQEMLRMGIYIPERDAAWELEENAFGDLLQVYQHCDAVKCHSHRGRKYSSQSGYFEIVRCKLCGSRGTHRKCSNLKLYESDWICADCKAAVEGKKSVSLPNYVESPLTLRQERKRLFKNISDLHSSIISKRQCVPATSPEVLMDLACQISQQQSTEVLVEDDEGVLEAALQALRQTLRDDLYFEVGSLLALSLVHGGPPLGFFSPALYRSLFNYPTNYRPTLQDLGDTAFAHKIRQIVEANSMKELRCAMQSASQYLEAAGCWRKISKLSEKDVFREGLRTLGLFEQVQMCTEAFHSVFCGPVERLTAESVMELFTVQFSEEKEQQEKESTTLNFWKKYLHECDEGRCAASFEDLLTFATATDLVPSIGFHPTPSISFFSSSDPSCAFPQSHCDANHLILPILPSYELFKKHLDYTLCQFSVHAGHLKKKKNWIFHYVYSVDLPNDLQWSIYWGY
ncbi:hypothetical protein cypCar_00023136 [Cyprinus carpio]|nr:hypothetical protein cypCar_00023136 [Cyprinus carpio]